MDMDSGKHMQSKFKNRMSIKAISGVKLHGRRMFFICIYSY